MEDAIRVEANCAICRSEYTLPRLLECFHTFCTPCLEELFKDKSIFSCPLCRIVSDVPKDGVESFKLYSFHGLLKKETETKNKPCCQMCEESVMLSFCKDCDQHMCRNCHEYHLKHKTFRNHKTQKYENKAESKEIPVQQCDHHNKDYNCYCKSCNIPICEECKKKTHSSHKTQQIQDAANCMKTGLKLATEGLKSKLPYIDNFIDNAKAEEKKYWSHIRQTETEMKTAAANLKEMLCTSVDLFLAQNIGMLNSESRVDKKLIQTYIEEADRDRMSIVNLIKTSEDTDRFADDYTLLTTGSTLCRQIGLCERSCFQSELKISSPFYLAGNISYGPIRDIVGIVQRKNVPVINLKLQLPILELPRYATLYNNIHRLNTIEFKQQSNSIWAVGDDSVQVSQLKTELKERTIVKIGGIQQVKLDGSVLWQLETIVEGNTRFKIIDAQIGKAHVLCDNLIKIVEWTETEPNTFKTTDSKIGSIDIACRLNNENLLVFNADEKKLLCSRQ